MKTYLDDDGLFWTSDMGLATALLVKYPILEFNTNDPSKIGFGFKESADIHTYAQKYWNKELQIEPQMFYNELLMLRKRINQEIR